MTKIIATIITTNILNTVVIFDVILRLLITFPIILAQQDWSALEGLDAGARVERPREHTQAVLGKSLWPKS